VHLIFYNWFYVHVDPDNTSHEPDIKQYVHGRSQWCHCSHTPLYTVFHSTYQTHRGTYSYGRIAWHSQRASSASIIALSSISSCVHASCMLRLFVFVSPRFALCMSDSVVPLPVPHSKKATIHWMMNKIQLSWADYSCTNGPKVTCYF